MLIQLRFWRAVRRRWKDRIHDSRLDPGSTPEERCDAVDIALVQGDAELRITHDGHGPLEAPHIS